MAFDNSGTKAVACDHPQKGVNYHLSSPELDKPYVVEKLSISEAYICSFSKIGQKIKNYSSLNFLQENSEKFRSTELYDAPLEGSKVRATCAQHGYHS